MKNLLLVLAFALISSTGFSQTFSYSSSEIGQHIQHSYVTVTNGGYNFSYSISSYGYNTTVIGSSHFGNFNLSHYLTPSVTGKSGSGNTGTPNSSFTSDQIDFVIINGKAGSSGSASITISCY